MGIFNGLISSLPVVNVQGVTVPPWLELVAIIIIAFLLIVSLLPKLSKARGFGPKGYGKGGDGYSEVNGGTVSNR